MSQNRYRIEVDPSKCVGAGQCVASAADVFDQRDSDGTVVLLVEEPAPARRAAVDKAALLCPAQAITIVESV